VRKDNHWGLRSKLVMNPGDNLKITLAGDYYSLDDDTALYLFPISVSPTTRLATGPISGVDSPAGYVGGTHIRLWGVSGKIELDTGIGTVSSITSYRKIRNESHFDIDGTATDLLHLDYHSGNETLQQELRLASNTTEPLSWQLGAFYLHVRAFNDQFQNGLALRGNTTHIDSIGKTDSISVFGEATYALTPTTHLTGGIRYTSDHRTLPVGATDTIAVATGAVVAHRTNVIDKVTYGEVTFRGALRQDLSDKVSVYASVNRGFKSGQFNLQTPQDAPVKPETIMAYEAGLKGDFLDSHLRLNLAVFHYDIADYQIRSSPAGVSVLANAANVKVDGVDINAEAKLSDRLHLTAGASWLNSKFSSFPKAANPGANAALPSGDATGLQTALAPHFTLNLGGTYTVPVGDSGELRLSANFSHKSSYVFEADNLLRQPAYDVINGSIEYAINDHFAIEGYMRNIGDRYYNVQMVTSVGQAALSAAPRQYGVNLKVNY
jgi:iron complex outermembrane receptor protein